MDLPINKKGSIKERNVFEQCFVNSLYVKIDVRSIGIANVRSYHFHLNANTYDASHVLLR